MKYYAYNFHFQENEYYYNDRLELTMKVQLPLVNEQLKNNSLRMNIVTCIVCLISPLRIRAQKFTSE